MNKENEKQGTEAQEITAAEEEKQAGVTVESSLRDEIDGAVTEVTEKMQAEQKASEEKPVEENLSEEKPAEEKKEEKPEEEVIPKDDEIPDALIERAVKAGISIPDAKSFKKADALERMCGVLEKKQESAGNEKKAESDKKEDDPLAAIPDLDPKDLDPDEYDEKVIAVVGAVKALKDIVRKQQETIDGLSRDGKSHESSWFDSQVAALGKSYAEVVGDGDRAKLASGSPQAKKLADLESKFNVLSAGYKAAGQDVEKEAVFQEAVSLVIGDVKAQSEASLKAGELEKRKKLHINRPSGASVKATEDPESDVASELDRKFFGKK